MKETGLLNSQVVEDSRDKEGEDIENLKVFEVVDRKEASGSTVIRTKCRHEQGNARETKRSGSMGCTGVQMDGGPLL